MSADLLHRNNRQLSRPLGTMQRIPKVFRSRSKLPLEPILEVRAGPSPEDIQQEPSLSAVEERTPQSKTPLYVQNHGVVPLSRSPADVKKYTTLKFDGGERYEGEVVENEPKGYGVYHFAEEGVSKSTFSGEWKASKPHGFGVRVHANRTRYVGKFEDGVYDGMGVCTMEDGMIAGQWKNGFPHGVGMQEASEGGPSSYVGTYKYGLRSGPGVYNYSNGDEYCGMFADDVPHGLGVSRLEGGQASYLGRWNRGNRHGWSIFTLADSTVWSGKWEHGKLIWQMRVMTSNMDAYPEDEAEALSRSWSIARAARAASDTAVNAANSFCMPGGPHLVELEVARKRGEAACKAAESAARRARAFKKLQWQPPKEAHDGTESEPEATSPKKAHGLAELEAEAPVTPDSEDIKSQLQAEKDAEASPATRKAGGPVINKKGPSGVSAIPQTDSVRHSPGKASVVGKSIGPIAAEKALSAHLKAAGRKAEGSNAAVEKKQKAAADKKKVASEYNKAEAVRRARIVRRAQWHQLLQDEPASMAGSGQTVPHKCYKSDESCSDEEAEARRQREMFLQRALKRALTPSPRTRLVLASRSH